MSNPNVLTLDNIRDFMLSRGGRVTNHELVKHFKNILTNEHTREEARVLFKELVNTLATISRDEYGAKQLVLRKKYRSPEILSTEPEEEGYTTSPVPTLTPMHLNLNYTPVYQTTPETTSIGESLASSFSLKNVPIYHLEDTTDISRRPSLESFGTSCSKMTKTSRGSSPICISGTPSLTSSMYFTSSMGSSAGSSLASSLASSIASSRILSNNKKLESPASSSATLTTPQTSFFLGKDSDYDDSSAYSQVRVPRLKGTKSPVAQKDYRKVGPAQEDSWNKNTSTKKYIDSDPPSTKSQLSEDSTIVSRYSTPDADDYTPKVPPRKKSADRAIDNLSVSSNVSILKRPTTDPCYDPPIQTSLDEESVASAAVDQRENVSKISVKERSQKFDRMASESALNKLTSHNVNIGHKKKHDKADKDDEDTGSVQLLDGKTREWLVKCAQGDYQAIFKLVTENPKLVKFKDPTSGYTALHWAAKHGNLDIIKLIAGTHKADVNARTNGGYTPLHLATQLGHEEACNQLVKVYKADENLRDYSGRKPRQYQKTSGTSISADTYRKIKARKKHAAEKDLGFLRIGSLNVRVKKTTEAFSNFLGVGNAEKLHKHWGSADNLPQGDQKRMPPPKIAPIKKRKSKRAQDFAATKPTVIEHQQSAVPTPLANEPNIQHQQDSDSDTAAGFGSTWQSTV